MVAPHSGLSLLSIATSQENQLLLEIILLQEAAENYHLQPHTQFLTWFQDLEEVMDEDR